MPVTLPTSPGFSRVRPFLVDFGGVVPSALGGKSQRINRQGNRFGIEVSLPPMLGGDTALAWVAALNLAQTDGAILNWPQVGFTPGNPGTILVNGAGQAGTALALDGATPNYAFKAGQFFSVLSGGRNTLQQITAAGSFSIFGIATLSILPELRFSPADNAPCNFAAPVIEGWLQGNGRDWDVDQARTYGLTFSVVEY